MKTILALTAFAFASQTAYADNVKLNGYTGATIGASSVKYSTDDEEPSRGIHFGLNNGAYITLNNHKIGVHANILRHGGQVRNTQYGISTDYGYHISLGNGLSITPKIGLGYKKLDLTSEDLKLPNTFTQIGVSVRKEFANWSVQPEITYQHDLNSKTLLRNANTPNARTIFLGKEKTYRVSTTIENKLNQDTALYITPFYERSSRSVSIGNNSIGNRIIQQAGTQIGLRF